jgi:hypothetical protein
MEEKIFLQCFHSEEVMIPLHLCSWNREIAGRLSPNHNRGL